MYLATNKHVVMFLDSVAGAVSDLTVMTILFVISNKIIFFLGLYDPSVSREHNFNKSIVTRYMYMPSRTGTFLKHNKLFSL